MSWSSIKSFIKKLYGAFIVSPLQRYNVENRAFKALDSQKKIPSKVHQSTHDLILQYIKEHPEIKEIASNKPQELLQKLEQIKVTSKSYKIEPVEKSETKRKLPHSRAQQPFYSYGDIEPESIPKGKISLSKTVELVTNYGLTPHKYSYPELAENLNMKQEDVENIINYFKPFKLYVTRRYTEEYKNLNWLEKKRLEYLGIPKPQTLVNDPETKELVDRIEAGQNNVKKS